LVELQAAAVSEQQLMTVRADDAARAVESDARARRPLLDAAS
jgi:hypothetical protein